MKILNQTTDTITVQGERRALTFWILGDGLLPLHLNPKISEDNEVKSQIKKHLRK